MATFTAWDLGDWKLDVSVQSIEVTSIGPEPDPDWTYIDAAHHAHDASRALLVWVLDDPDEPDVWIDADGDEHNADAHWECKLCGEFITPGTRANDGFRKFVPGSVTAIATDPDGLTYVLTKDEYEVLKVRGPEAVAELIAAR